MLELAPQRDRGRGRPAGASGRARPGGASSGARGTALIDFAFALFIFFGLTIGMIDLGLGVWQYNTLSNASREGVRYAIVRGSESTAPASAADIAAIVRHQAAGLDSVHVTVTTTWLPNNDPGSAVKVRAQYDFSPFTLFLPPGTIVLSSTSQMVISQ